MKGNDNVTKSFDTIFAVTKKAVVIVLLTAFWKLTFIMKKVFDFLFFFL